MNKDDKSNGIKNETFEEHVNRIYDEYSQMDISEDYKELWEAFKMIVEDIKELQELDENMDETIEMLRDSGMSEDEILDVILNATVDDEFINHFDTLASLDITDEMLEIAMAQDPKHPDFTELELCNLGLSLEEAQTLMKEVSLILTDEDDEITPSHLN